MSEAAVRDSLLQIGVISLTLLVQITSGALLRRWMPIPIAFGIAGVVPALLFYPLFRRLSASGDREQTPVWTWFPTMIAAGVIGGLVAAALHAL